MNKRLAGILLVLVVAISGCLQESSPTFDEYAYWADTPYCSDLISSFISSELQNLKKEGLEVTGMTVSYYEGKDWQCELDLFGGLDLFGNELNLEITRGKFTGKSVEDFKTNVMYYLPPTGTPEYDVEKPREIYEETERYFKFLSGNEYYYLDKDLMILTTVKLWEKHDPLWGVPDKTPNWFKETAPSLTEGAVEIPTVLSELPNLKEAVNLLDAKKIPEKFSIEYHWDDKAYFATVAIDVFERQKGEVVRSRKADFDACTTVSDLASKNNNNTCKDDNCFCYICQNKIVVMAKSTTTSVSTGVTSSPP